MIHRSSAPLSSESAVVRRDEQGWALLGLILALAIMAIMMASFAPNIQTQVKRDKEEEMIYRGQQMAEAIARYYNQGAPGFIRLEAPPPYGYLTDLSKLRSGIMRGVTQVKLVRASAMIDPMVNDEWEPVRMRDPRLANALQAYSAYNQVMIPQSWMIIAGVFTTQAANPLGTPIGQPGGLSPQTGIQPVGPNGNISTGRPLGTPANPQSPNGNANANRRPGGNRPSQDGDDDDDDTGGDPLAHLLPPGFTPSLPGAGSKKGSDKKLGQSNLPIVGVAPRLKGKAIRNLWGMTSYDDWVFIFIPRQGVPINGGQTNGPLRVSQ
ncbi:MAG: hypothetical protein DMF61_02675 [Blastocatellia bacterium AA13]|nr:MAG: hypothetical protein DMF61_02675 [Blastocatellia bacterium AA13]